MKIIPQNPKIQDIWGAYPIRIPGGSICVNCQQETVLVQSMNGGFVTRNCPKCNRKETLPESVFKELKVWVACPKCKKRMEPEHLPDSNYGYICTLCDIGIPLYHLVPRWEDL